MVFNSPRPKGTKHKVASGKGTPIKKPNNQAVKTRSSKSVAKKPEQQVEDETVAAQERLLAWMKQMEPHVENAPSAAEMEASWNSQFDHHLHAAEQTVREEAKAMEIIGGSSRMPTSFSMFASLSSSETKIDIKDLPGPSGVIPKKKKRDVSVSPPEIDDDTEEGQKGEENGTTQEENEKPEESVLIHEFDIGPMDLNEAQKELMQSHIKDIIDVLMSSAFRVTLEMNETTFKLYRGSQGPLNDGNDRISSRSSIHGHPPKKRCERVVSYPRVFNSKPRTGTLAQNMIRVSIRMKASKKKVVYTVPRADDGSPVTALQEYMRAKGKADWGLRNLDYETAKII